MTVRTLGERARIAERWRPRPRLPPPQSFLYVDDAVRLGRVYVVQGVIRCLQDGTVLSGPVASGMTGAGCRVCRLVIGQPGDEEGHCGGAT